MQPDETTSPGPLRLKFFGAVAYVPYEDEKLEVTLLEGSDNVEGLSGGNRFTALPADLFTPETAKGVNKLKLFQEVTGIYSIDPETEKPVVLEWEVTRQPRF